MKETDNAVDYGDILKLNTQHRRKQHAGCLWEDRLEELDVVVTRLPEFTKESVGSRINAIYKNSHLNCDQPDETGVSSSFWIARRSFLHVFTSLVAPGFSKASDLASSSLSCLCPMSACKRIANAG